jgi:ribonuclease HI
LQEAKDFAAGKISATAPKPQGDKFYGVAVGHVPGVYEDWAVAAEQIKDVKGPKYRKFSTREEAEEFVRSGGKSSGVAAAPPTKKVKTSQSSATDRSVHAYTDGSSRGNGRRGALAGVGVFFGDGDSRYGCSFHHQYSMLTLS